MKKWRKINEKPSSGCRGVSLFPVLVNSTEAYAVGARIPLNEVMEMTKEADTNEIDIHADDRLYASVKTWLGMNATITVAELPLHMMAELGFGTYDAAANTLKWNPQGRNLEFAVTLRSPMLDGGYRMYKLYSFTVSEIRESGLRTRGNNTQVNTHQIIGTFTARKWDDLPGEKHEGDDLSWLNTVEAEGDTSGLTIDVDGFADGASGFAADLVGVTANIAPQVAQKTEPPTEQKTEPTQEPEKPKKSKQKKTEPDTSALDIIDPLNPLDVNEGESET